MSAVNIYDSGYVYVIPDGQRPLASNPPGLDKLHLLMHITLCEINRTGWVPEGAGRTACGERIALQAAKLVDVKGPTVSAEL